MIRECDLPVKQVVDIADNIRAVSSLGESVVVALTELSKTIFDSYEGIEIEGRYESIGEAIGDIKRSLASLDSSVESLSESLGTVEGDVTTISGNVDTLLSDVSDLKTDYVVEQGTSGIWTYRKWSNGVSECWGKVQWETSYTQWGSVYYSTGSPQQDYPSGLFIEQPCEIANLLGGGGDGWLGTNSAVQASKDNTNSYYRMRPNSTTATTATIAIHSIGKWK